MSLTMDYNANFFANYEGIRYLTGWHDEFKPNRFSGRLFFYPGFVKKIVNVYHTGIKKDLKEEEVHIMVGRHNSDTIQEDVERNKDTIYEMCRTPNSPRDFVLNLSTMKVVTREDFTELLPSRGLNTLFVFENIRNNNFYCVVNPLVDIAKGPPVPDIEFYTWLVSYVYSQMCCLSTDKKDNIYGKQFMQAISSLACGVAKKGSIFISKNSSVLNCEMSDIGERDVTPPGKSTDRFTDLVAKAWMEQFPAKSSKEKVL